MKPLQNGTNKPFTITIASTKGGSAKSTNAANIGAFCAEHGLRTLLIDTDTQPTLSSYYELEYQAPGGTYEFLHFKDVNPTHIISRTTIPNLDLIQSNDPSNKISPMLRDSPDGALRFSLLLQKIEGYDVIIIDTRVPEILLSICQYWLRMFYSVLFFPTFYLLRSLFVARLECIKTSKPLRHLALHYHR